VNNIHTHTLIRTCSRGPSVYSLGHLCMALYPDDDFILGSLEEGVQATQAGKCVCVFVCVCVCVCMCGWALEHARSMDRPTYTLLYICTPSHAHTLTHAHPITHAHKLSLSLFHTYTRTPPYLFSASSGLASMISHTDKEAASRTSWFSCVSRAIS
jgi:hypothetical protein